VSNSFLKPSAITAECLRILHNNLAFVGNIDKQHDKETTFGGQKRGSTLRIRLPNQYTVRETWAINAQDQSEASVSLVIGQIRGVDMNFSDADLALEINEFSKRFIQPAMSVLATKIDHYCYGKAVEATYNLVGTAGTAPSSVATWMSAHQKLNESVAPTSPRIAIVNPAAEAATVDGLKALFNNSTEIGKQYMNGKMGRALGLDWYMSQNVKQLTRGTRSTLLVGTTVTEQGSTTIAIDTAAGASDTFVAGDVFTVGSVYKVNPETKETTGALQQFVVTTAASCTTNAVSLTVSPAMYTTGAKQNIDAFPTDGATITMVGTASTAYPENLVFHPEAYTFASANLEMPGDVGFKAQMAQDGINIRILRQYDINSANYPMRMDVFFGFLAQRPEFGCRVIG
jgi:hypothetical protein